MSQVVPRSLSEIARSALSHAGTIGGLEDLRAALVLSSEEIAEAIANLSTDEKLSMAIGLTESLFRPAVIFDSDGHALPTRRHFSQQSGIPRPTTRWEVVTGTSSSAPHSDVGGAIAPNEEGTDLLASDQDLSSVVVGARAMRTACFAVFYDLLTREYSSTLSGLDGWREVVSEVLAQEGLTSHRALDVARKLTA